MPARGAGGRFTKSKAVRDKQEKKRTWQQALKAWNKGKQRFTIPKKGTAGYRQVQALR